MNKVRRMEADPIESNQPIEKLSEGKTEEALVVDSPVRTPAIRRTVLPTAADGNNSTAASSGAFAPKPEKNTVNQAKKAPQQKHQDGKTEVALPSFGASVKAPNLTEANESDISELLAGRTAKTATPIEQRIRAIQEKRSSSAKAAAGREEGWDAFAKRFKEIFSRLINGKPVTNQAAMDFPINRGIFGRMKRYGPAKVYRLKGYTTVGRVNKKRQRDLLKKQRNRLIFIGIFLLGLILLYIALDPLPKLHSFMHDIGY